MNSETGTYSCFHRDAEASKLHAQGAEKKWTPEKQLQSSAGSFE